MKQFNQKYEKIGNLSYSKKIFYIEISRFELYSWVKFT